MNDLTLSGGHVLPLDSLTSIRVGYRAFYQLYLSLSGGKPSSRTCECPLLSWRLSAPIDSGVLRQLEGCVDSSGTPSVTFSDLRGFIH